MPDQVPAPRPSIESLTLLKQLSEYAVTRQPMDPNQKELLKTAIGDQQDQIRLVLSVMGSHKMLGMADLLRAFDFVKQRLLDPKYLASISDDPAELRKTLRLLSDVLVNDIEYLKMMTSDNAEKEGFAKDPKTQYNFFFDQGPRAGAAVLPEEMGSESRRKIMSVLDKILALADDKVPVPPGKSERVIDVEAEITDRDDRSKPESDGPGTVHTSDS